MDSAKDKSEFKEMNYTLRAGNNPNTIGLPCVIARHNELPNAVYFVSKWKLEDYERQNFVVRLYNALEKEAETNPYVRDLLGAYNVLPDRYKSNGPYNEEDLRTFLLKLADCMPAIYLSAMGAPTPVMLHYENPFGGGIPGIKDEDAPGFMKADNDLADKWNGINNEPSEN